MSIKERYQAIKEKYNNPLVIFHDDEYYNIFFDDAKTVAQLLKLQVTSFLIGSEHIPDACFFFYTDLDKYLNQLINVGYRVAVVELNQEKQNAA